jgi:predicted aspartyl protease
MRLLIGLLMFAALAAGDVARLHELADTRQFFLLREALQQPAWNNTDTLFYRGMVESRFGQEPKGIDDLARFLASHTSPDLRRRAYEELAAALGREGRYGEAARNLADALRLAPSGERTDAANSQDVYAALADVPPQSVAIGTDVPVRATFNQLGTWDVPVDVNGRRSQLIFDTGANWSTLSASEAERLGLATRASDTYVRGSTGKKNALRLAVANDLQLGRAHLKHVIFLVLSDDSLFIGPLKYQIHGFLGLPVLRALGRVGIAATGTLRIEPGRTVRATPNLFFDGKAPIVEVRHDDRRIRMLLDTGANATVLHRSFRSALTKDEVAGLTARNEQTGGAGEIIVRRTEAVPTLRLFVSGRAANLSDVSLLTTAPEGDARYRDGVLGTDALRSGFTLDFRAMQLRLDGS